MTADYTRPPWTVDQASVDGRAAPGPHTVVLPMGSVNGTAAPLPQPGPSGNGRTPAISSPAAVTEMLAESDYRVVEELRDRVSTRLSGEDKHYPPAARRELTKKLIRDEYDQWQLYQAN